MAATTRTLISPARLNRPAGRRIYWTLVILVVVVSTVAFIGPFYWMVTGGLKTGQEIAQIPPTLFPKQPDVGNYFDAWTGIGLGQLLLNTIWYAAGALAFQVGFGVTAAYSISRAVSIPVMCSSGLSSVTAPMAVTAGAAGVVCTNVYLKFFAFRKNQRCDFDSSRSLFF